MKLCFILEHAYPHQGGVETAFHELGKNLVTKGHSVVILTSQSGGQTETQVIAGVEYHYFAWRSFFNHALPEEKDIAPFVKDYDIVHTTTYTAAPTASKVAQKYNKPCIITANEVLGKKWFWVESNPIKAILFYLFEQYVIHLSYSKYHAVSNATKKDIIASGIPSDRIEMIYWGVDVEMDFPIKGTEARLRGNDKESSDDTRFLYFGRPGKTKGIFILLEAIRTLHNSLEKKYSFQFILSAHPQEERAEFIRQVKEYQLEERITVSSSLEKKELIQAISRAFCVIVPSITEGFGFTTAETSALRVPLIISDAGSLPEVASGKVLMFKNKNSNDLAEKIKEATSGNFTPIPEKRFDWNETAIKMDHLYKTLLIK